MIFQNKPMLAPIRIFRNFVQINFKLVKNAAEIFLKSVIYSNSALKHDLFQHYLTNINHYQTLHFTYYSAWTIMFSFQLLVSHSAYTRCLDASTRTAVQVNCLHWPCKPE